MLEKESMRKLSSFTVAVSVPAASTALNPEQLLFLVWRENLKVSRSEKLQVKHLRKSLHKYILMKSFSKLFIRFRENHFLQSLRQTLFKAPHNFSRQGSRFHSHGGSSRKGL